MRDLRAWPLHEKPLIPLSGTWALQGEGFPSRAEVPGTWKPLLGHSGNVGMEARYTLRLHLPASWVGERLMLDFGNVRPLFRARVNGKLVAQSGVQLTEDYVFPSRAYTQVAFVATAAVLDVEVWVQHVGELQTGLRIAPILGPEGGIQRRLQRRQTLLNLLLGSTFILLFYHGILYVQRRDISLVYFMGICVSSLLYYGFYFAHLPEFLWQDLPFSVSVRLTRVGIYAFGYLGFAYIHTLFAMPHYAKIRGWVLGCVGLALVGLLLPLPLMHGVHRLYLALSLLWLLYCARHLVKVWVAAPTHNRLFFTSLAVLTVCLIQDALHHLLIIQGGFWMPWGSMAFLLGQAGFLSQRFHQDFLRAQTLQQALESTNQGLESRIEERTAYLRLQAQQIQQMSEFKEKMVRMIVHDLRTPLSTILYFTHRRAPSVEQSQWVYEAALKANHMLQSLSELKDMEQAQLKVHLLETELLPLVQDAVKQIQPWVQRKQLQVIFWVPPGLRVQADTTLLLRVLQNLLSNACEHSFAGGKLFISVCQQKQWVYLCVVDQGPGIDAELLPTLFSLKATGARGLGLPFCHMAVHAQHGTLHLETSARGTQVHLHLPGVARKPLSLTLSEAEREHLRPLVTALQALPFYRFSELEALLQARLQNPVEPETTAQAYVRALYDALYQAREDDYNELLEQLVYACTAG